MFLVMETALYSELLLSVKGPLLYSIALQLCMFKGLKF